MTSALALIARVPWQAWALIAAMTFGGLWHWQAVDASYKRGKSDAIHSIEKDTRDAEKRADDELRRLDRGDRGRVSDFDRD